MQLSPYKWADLDLSCFPDGLSNCLFQFIGFTLFYQLVVTMWLRGWMEMQVVSWTFWMFTSWFSKLWKADPQLHGDLWPPHGQTSLPWTAAVAAVARTWCFCTLAKVAVQTSCRPASQMFEVFRTQTKFLSSLSLSLHNNLSCTNQYSSLTLDQIWAVTDVARDLNPSL